jgi:hypothetical protein
VDIVGREGLRHNEFNAVTASIEKVETADGRVLVCKRLGRHKPNAPDHWLASDDPTHWNYWRREAEAYLSPVLRESLAGTGLEIPRATVEEHEAETSDDGVTLWIDYVPGTPGVSFDLVDHQALARGLGRWQAGPPLAEPWCSRGFIRAYSSSKPAPYELVGDPEPWSQPIIRDCFPGVLRAGWPRLLANRERLLGVLERLPRTRCHLDVWAGNATRRPDGTVALFDWSFCGDGALGEDIGNQVPDGVFDLFWPAERLAEVEAAVFGAYLDGLRSAGWDGDHRVVRLGMVASCVKYAWLLPMMLAEAANPTNVAYWREVSPTLKFTARGIGLARLVAWCDEALVLADRLGY